MGRESYRYERCILKDTSLWSEPSRSNFRFYSPSTPIGWISRSLLHLLSARCETYWQQALSVEKACLQNTHTSEYFLHVADGLLALLLGGCLFDITASNTECFARSVDSSLTIACVDFLKELE